jgi:lycopene cyclase CruA
LVRGDLPRDAVIEVDGPLPETEADFDMIYAGGGLGLVSAAVMAQRYNRRILIFDRYRPGATHREWNICDWELRQLVRMQLLTEAELERIIAARYRTGIIEFTGTHSRWQQHTLWIDNVLDLAVEADALLTLSAEKICAADNGSQVRGGLTFSRVYIPKSKRQGASNAVVEVIDETGMIHRYGARLVVDAMGAGSPISYALSGGRPYAGVCPTVGTVARGFVEGSGTTQVDPHLGEVLITRSDTTNGRQLIWEGFPSGDDRTTVYLFYYNALAPGRAADSGDLLELYEQYYTLLPTYKQPGPNFEHLKPVYGFIPSRARESPREAGATRANRNIVALGDSSAQQSPLTFCGFGSYIRNLDRTTALLDYALRHNLLEADHLRLIGAQQANVSLNWIFSRFMEPRRNRLARPNEVNEMMNLICTVIDEIGPAFAQRYFKDRAGWPELSLMLWKIMRKYPGIWVRAATTVGIHGMVLWALDYLAFLRDWILGEAYTAIRSRITPQQAEHITALAERLAPAVWMRVEARKYAWYASSATLEPVVSAAE